MELRNIFVSDKRTIRLRHVTEIINPIPQKHFMQMLARKIVRIADAPTPDKWYLWITIAISRERK